MTEVEIHEEFLKKSYLQNKSSIAVEKQYGAAHKFWALKAPYSRYHVLFGNLLR